MKLLWMFPNSPRLANARRGWWRGAPDRPVFWLAIYTLLVLLIIAPTLDSYMWFGHEQLAPGMRTLALIDIWRAPGPVHAPWLAPICFRYCLAPFTLFAPLGF